MIIVCNLLCLTETDKQTVNQFKQINYFIYLFYFRMARIDPVTAQEAPIGDVPGAHKFNFG